jgi:hypothetical protein
MKISFPGELLLIFTINMKEDFKEKLEELKKDLPRLAGRL